MAGEGASDLSGLLAQVCSFFWKGPEEALLNGRGSLALRGCDLLDDLVGNTEKQFGLEGGNRIEKAFSNDFLGKTVGDGIVHPVKIA